MGLDPPADTTDSEVSRTALDTWFGAFPYFGVPIGLALICGVVYGALLRKAGWRRPVSVSALAYVVMVYIIVTTAFVLPPTGPLTQLLLFVLLGFLLTLADSLVGKRWLRPFVLALVGILGVTMLLLYGLERQHVWRTLEAKSPLGVLDHPDWELSGVNSDDVEEYGMQTTAGVEAVIMTEYRQDSGSQRARVRTFTDPKGKLPKEECGPHGHKGRDCVRRGDIIFPKTADDRTTTSSGVAFHRRGSVVFVVEWHGGQQNPERMARMVGPASTTQQAEIAQEVAMPGWLANRYTSVIEDSVTQWVRE